MAKILKFKRGNTAKNNAYTGSAGELTVDTSKKTVVVHDGVTAGGSALATDVTVSTHTSRVDNPHGVSKTQVGLGNVLNVDSTNPNNIVQDSTHRFVTDSDKINWNGKINATEKAVANGVATLDVNGKVVLTQIPDSVLGQLEYMGTYSFSGGMPIATQKGQYWIASADGNGYITGDWAVWNGTSFDKVDNTDAVATVAGRTGNVVLTKSDVGLANVDNTADIDKPISTATQTVLNNKVDKVTSTDNAIARFDGTTGKLQNSGVTIDDGGLITGSLNGNASTATKFSTDRTNYITNSDSAVAGELKWSAYGNNHTIIDASSGISPTGQAIPNTNTLFPWHQSYPVLVGYNGVNTYGVKVDTARYAETAKELLQVATFPTANNQDFNTLMAGGVYNIIFGNYAGTLNAPPTGDAYGTMFVENGVNFTTQKYSALEGREFHRTLHDGVWRPWKASVKVSDYIATTNTVPRFDGDTISLKNSGVTIDDNGNVVVGGSTATFSDGISRGIYIESPGPYADAEFRVNGSGSWFTSYSNNTTGAGYGGWKHIGSSGQIKNWVYTAGQGETQFGTDGVERMRIGKSGNLLIGTTTDNGVDKLQVNGSISQGEIPGITVDLNTLKTLTKTYVVTHTSANIPIADYGYLEIIVHVANTWCMQRFTTLGVAGAAPSRVFVRCLASNAWSAWVEK